jgi:hypothetical protein
MARLRARQAATTATCRDRVRQQPLTISSPHSARMLTSVTLPLQQPVTFGLRSHRPSPGCLAQPVSVRGRTATSCSM